jgi:hypothetical protein
LRGSFANTAVSNNLKTKNMKSILFIILTSLSFMTIAVGQNLPIAKKLDEKNGFKEFQIGDSFSKWQANLTFTNSNGDNKFYTYTGSCCQQVFSTDLERIRLGFKDNKLVVIYLETKTVKNESSGWVSSDYKSIKGSFEILFGVESPDIPSDDNSGKVSSFWMGEKLFLDLTYEYMGVKQFGDNYAGTGRCTLTIGINVPLDDGF